MYTINPLITIIVPVYNTEKFLTKCINSICEQTYRNLEIILINDGSSDSSLEICNIYKNKDPRIKVFSQKNKGLIETRKLGLKYSIGDLIGFVDSDDWIEKNMYMNLIESFKKTNADLISSGIIHDYENSNENNGTYVYDNYLEGLYTNLDKDIYPTMLYDNEIRRFGLNCNLVTKLFKKEILTKVYENINSKIFYGEDCLTIYSYCLLAKSIYIQKKAFYHYNIRMGSMCLKKDEKLPYNSYLLYSELKKKFYEYKDPYCLMRQLKKYILKIEAHNLNMLFDINVNSLGIWNFKFNKEIYNSKFIIYGAGACGQAFYQFLCSKNMEKQIVAWIDKNPSNKSDQCLYQIDSPDILLKIQYDYIIIAILKEKLEMSIRAELIEKYHIENDKILWKQPEYIPIFN